MEIKTIEDRKPREFQMVEHDWVERNRKELN